MAPHGSSHPPVALILCRDLACLSSRSTFCSCTLAQRSVWAVSEIMAASLLRRGSYNSRDIRFELEATIVVFEEEKAAMQKLGPKVEVSPATKRLWQELQQEKVSVHIHNSRGIG
ncbi:hypothetical protein Esi_0160_0022 [Ectocarpus siliculosus]|uniref:Uncharacterized protein n=1 Tax=Ectocarpus siliculosus TaxID=2880 RepID=D7FLQ9_ECTSI|nr:hypothetical protein Esi_0160_0022 [Ectocarpus siliculosus]|eukprot:CBJ29734.1 hypothetical protein Esi_0160_0022 [Ectocarpus siliculosus]